MPMFDDAVLFFICAMPLVACLYLMIHGLSLRSDFGLGWARALLLAGLRQIMKEMYYELVFVSWNPSLLPFITLTLCSWLSCICVSIGELILKRLTEAWPWMSASGILNYFGVGDAYRALLATGSNGKQRVANQNYFGAGDAYWTLLGSNGKQRGQSKTTLGRGMPTVHCWEATGSNGKQWGAMGGNWGCILSLSFCTAKNPNCYACLGNYFEDEDAYCRPLPKQVRTSICYACLRNYFGAGDAYWALLGSKGQQRGAN